MTKIPPQITARSWVVFDVENTKYLEGKNPYNSREVASLTKIMTFFTTLKVIELFGKGFQPQTVFFKVSKQAAQINGTNARLRDGMWISLNDLFYALMLPSGNDAALVLAENMGTVIYFLKDRLSIQQMQTILQNKEMFYSYFCKLKNPIHAFLVAMNKHAKDLVMSTTNYANPHGLMNKENRSSAYDMAKLCCHALKFLKFKEVVNCSQYSCTLELKNGVKENFVWENTNKLIGKQGWYGIKTGITDAAGPSLASCVQIFDQHNKIFKKFVIILLNCQNQDIRWEESEKLAQWAINNYDKKIE